MFQNHHQKKEVHFLYFWLLQFYGDENVYGLKRVSKLEINYYQLNFCT